MENLSILFETWMIKTKCPLSLDKNDEIIPIYKNTITDCMWISFQAAWDISNKLQKIRSEKNE